MSLKFIIDRFKCADLKYRIVDGFPDSNIPLLGCMADLPGIHDRYKAGQPIVLVGGGETTVELKGNGKGGRNQEMVLAFAIEAEALLQLSRHDFFSCQYDLLK